MFHKILVTGSRDFMDEAFVWEQLDKYCPSWSVLIHGDCPTGADSFAKTWAEKHPEVYHIAMPAKWETSLGKSAGPHRNRAMIGLNPSLVLAFFKEGAVNRGTRSCVGLAYQQNIQVHEFWK